MKFTDEELVTGVGAGDIRAVSRLITLTENDTSRAWTILSRLFSAQTPKATVIGITGAPGSGKSTLVDHLATELSARGEKVAILCIDPTSPFTGGAILGDRIRMNRTVLVPNIFIRSMATRGALGGLSRTTFEAIHVLEVAGYSTILIETVGVGQVEVDVVKTVDTCLVVLVPGMGDAVQTFKAGILEIADIFVINKSDKDGADLVHRDLNLLLSLGNYPEGSWKPAICRTVATEARGVPELGTIVSDHGEWLRRSSEGTKRRQKLAKDVVLRLITEEILTEGLKREAKEIERIVESYSLRREDPFSNVRQIVSKLLR